MKEMTLQDQSCFSDWHGGFFYSQQSPKDLVEVAAVALEEVVVVAAAGVLLEVVVDHLVLEAFFKQECQSSDLLQVEMQVRNTFQFQREKVNDIL